MPAARFIPVLWITTLLANYIVALDAAMYSIIFLLTLTMVWIILFPRNPGDLFNVGVILSRLISLLIPIPMLGLWLLLFTIDAPPIFSCLKIQ